MRKHYPLFCLVILTVIALDQMSKLIVLNTIGLYESVPVIKGFFSLVHVRNRGMVFGLMNRPEINTGFYLLVLASMAAVIILVFWLIRLKENERGLGLGLCLIIGGALGNLADRIRLKGVVDFLDFAIGSYHWPAFNLADTAITSGTIWIGIYLVFFLKGSKTG